MLSSADGFEFMYKTAPAFCLNTIEIKHCLLSPKIEFEIKFVSLKVDFNKAIWKQIKICSMIFTSGGHQWLRLVKQKSFRAAPELISIFSWKSKELKYKRQFQHNIQVKG